MSVLWTIWVYYTRCLADEYGRMGLAAFRYFTALKMGGMISRTMHRSSLRPWCDVHLLHTQANLHMWFYAKFRDMNVFK